MCIDNIKPITHKSGFGYTVRMVVKGKLISPYKEAFTPLKMWQGAMEEVGLSKIELKQVGFHFFTNKRVALKFLKQYRQMYSNEVVRLVKLQYRSGKYSGTTSAATNLSDDKSLPCSTAMEIKPLEILSD